MEKQQVLSRIEEIGVIPAVRVSSALEAKFAVEAVASGGITVVEITMTVPGALDVIVETAKSAADIVVGAGTVLDSEMARRCIDAGANFITSPSLKLPVVELAEKQNVIVIPGALTPTEVETAWESGCEFVKVFPCSALGGPNYIRSLRKPFPTLRLMAAGGVNQNNVAEYVLCGASAVGIGASLLSHDTIEFHQAKRIRELSRRFLSLVSGAREELKARERRLREK